MSPTKKFVGRKKNLNYHYIDCRVDHKTSFMISCFYYINSCQTWLLKNPIFLLVTGNFNTGNSSQWKNDCVTREGAEIETYTCSYRLSQLTSDPTHILQNSSSCIELAFMNQPNLVIDSGMHPSSHFLNSV